MLQDIVLLIHNDCRKFDGSKSPARFWILQMTYRRAISRRRYLTSRHFYSRTDLDHAANVFARDETVAPYDHDINALATKVDKEVQPKVESALHDADEAAQHAAQAKRTAEQVVENVNQQLTSARGVTAKVEDLSANVAALESRTTVKVDSATKRIEQQVGEVDQRVTEAQSQIDIQQKKLTDTGELVKSLFTNSRIELFDETMVGRYMVREGNNRRLVYMLLKEAPIPQSVQIEFYIFTQPRNSYIVWNNVVVLFWGDPATSVKQHQLLISYVADPVAGQQPYKTISVNKEHVFADSIQLPDVNSFELRKIAIRASPVVAVAAINPYVHYEVVLSFRRGPGEYENCRRNPA